MTGRKEPWKSYRLPPQQQEIYNALIERATYLPTRRERNLAYDLAERYATGVRLRMHAAHMRALRGFWSRLAERPEHTGKRNRPKRKRTLS